MHKSIIKRIKSWKQKIKNQSQQKKIQKIEIIDIESIRSKCKFKRKEETRWKLNRPESKIKEKMLKNIPLYLI